MLNCLFVADLVNNNRQWAVELLYKKMTHMKQMYYFLITNNSK